MLSKHKRHPNRQPIRRNTSRIRVTVRRSPARRPYIRPGDVPELRKGVDEGDGDGALGGRTGDGVADPGVESDEARIRGSH